VASTPNHALDGCRAKLDRAEQHLNALSDEIRATMEGEGDPRQLRTEFDEADRSTVVYYSEPQPLPIEWGVALGDVIHNTRSALDHLVYQLVLLAGGTPNAGHQFPIDDTSQAWTNSVARGRLDAIDQAHVTKIESFQPFTPGTGVTRLSVVRDFSNIDKHRLIHAAHCLYRCPQAVRARRSPEHDHGRARNSAWDTLRTRPGDRALSEPHGLRLSEGSDRRATTRIWTPDQKRLGVIEGMPENAEQRVDAQLHVTTVFGAPGVTYTRGRVFREAIGDVRAIVSSFDSAF